MLSATSWLFENELQQVNRTPALLRADSVALDSSEFSDALAERVATFDFSKEVVFSNVILKPGPKAIDYQAMIVASAHPGVIDGHNGMYSEPLMSFLIRYIGFTEAKKYLLAAQRSGAMKIVEKLTIVKTPDAEE